MTRFPSLLALAGALGLAGALAPARAADISVGAGAACSAHTIADALTEAALTPELDTIRLVNDQAYENLIVDIGTPVELVGGFADCADATPSGRTTLSGVGTWATVVIFGGDPSDSIEVHLRNLDVTGGGADQIGYVGGIAVDGRALVYIADTSVHDNVGPSGGGLGVLGANAIVTLERNVEIYENRAGTGAGVYVLEGTLRVRPQNVVVRDNHATAGGGIAIVDGLVSVSSDPDDSATAVDGFRIVDNDATDSGGGVYVEGVWGKLLADDTIIAGNRAGNEGGGVFAKAGGYAQLARNTMGPYRHCAAALECERLSENTANRGGAVALRDAFAHLDTTVVRDNTAAVASAFSIAGETSELRGAGSLVVRNACVEEAPGCETIGLLGGHLRLSYATFADNAGGDALIVATGTDGAPATGIELLSSLVAGKPRLFDLGNASLEVRFDCVIKDQGLTDITMDRSEVAPIAFVDAASGNYRLAPGNRAIDYCDATNAPIEDADRDGTARGTDLASQADAYGPWDLGAFEYVDTLFSSGFDPN